MIASGTFDPRREAALVRIDAVRPGEYARTRNALEGAVTGLSPYITHGLVNLPEVLAGVVARSPLAVQHKFVYELGWREYFRHVWQFRGDGILQSLRAGVLPEDCYMKHLPADIREASTGIPVIDMAVRTLYETGYLHNHARMWLASYVVHLRKVHWRAGADWLYGHLLDGDLASNHLSWQWVAGTASSKPYLFNAENVARFAPAPWHSPSTMIDQSYDALDRIARDPEKPVRPAPRRLESGKGQLEPELITSPPPGFGFTAPDTCAVANRDVWLVHPWNLGELPATLPPGTIALGVLASDFHRAWPWNETRWRFVSTRMAESTTMRWYGDAVQISAALKSARQVHSIREPHLGDWVRRWADCEAAPALFPSVERRCDSFSQWWTRASRGIESAAQLLANQPVIAKRVCP